jgi:threonylcarbamoyladenosine tRNA methylthiotransferase MtaB
MIQALKMMKAKKVVKFNIITFGCKLNQAESDQISADLISKGYIKDSSPDLVIINACAVTHKAVREVRQKVSSLKRKFPHAKIKVYGCTEAGKKKYNLSNVHITEPSRSRALIKVQDGCNNFCAYCIVPYLRGKPTSIPGSRIIAQINSLKNHKEVVLTGVNIGLYKGGLAKLLEKVLKQTDIERIRLGSIWPTHITSDLIKLYAGSDRFMPHFHLSIQSGSNKILKKMGRTYTRATIKKITGQCKKKIPNINFTTDLIVGFPGETDKDFNDSCDLVSSIGFSKVHVFKYSARPKTRAATMPDQIDERVKQVRSRELIELSGIVGKKATKKFKTKKLPVLWEDKVDGYWYGFTSNYIRKKKKVGKKDLKNIISS